MNTRNSKQTRISRSFIAYLSRSLALTTLAAVGIGQAQAVNLTWDPVLDGDGLLGGNGIWDTTSLFWDPAPGTDLAVDNVAWAGTLDTAIFGGTAGTVTITTGTGVSASGLTFGVTGYTIAGATATDVLTLTGATPTITVTNTGETATISAITTGTTGLTTAGLGTLVLSGTNTYTGVTNVSTGTLSISNIAGLGATGAGNETTVASGATLDINGVAIGAEGISIAGAGVGGVGALTGTGTASLSGNVTLAAASTIGGAGSLTLSGVVSGAFDVTKVGAGTLTLSGVNTYSGITNINAGTLSIGAATAIGDASVTNTIALGGGTLRSTATLDLGVNRTIAVGAGGGTLSAQTGTTLTVSGALGGSGALGVGGGGTVVLSANNSGFSGNVTVNSLAGETTNSTLRLSNASALTSGTVTLNAGLAAAGGTGTTLDLTGVTIGSGVSLSMNSIAGSNARSVLTTSAGVNVWDGGIVMNGDGLNQLNTIGAGSSLTINGNITDGGGYTGITFLRGVGTGTINGTINTPNGNVSKTDGGTWIINSTGNSWAATSVAVGTLRTGIANALPSGTAVSLGQNDANNATLDLNGFSQTIGSLATNPVTGLTGNKTVTSATAATLTINGTANTTYAGVITGASLALVKQGAGIQTLTGANTFAGGTTIDAGGALRLGDQLANNLVLAAGTAITNNGTLIFAPGATNLTYNNAITGAGNITLDGLGGTGPAGITLSGANTGFTGSYTLTQGRMIFASQAAIGATTVPITVNGTAGNGGQLWVNGAFSVANPLTLNGYGALEAAGNLGAVRMAGGTLAGAITLGSNASINPENTNITISGNIGGLAGAQLLYGVPGTARNGNVTVTSSGGNTYAGGTLVRLGTGTATATVANSFGTGALQIDSGTVQLNVANALGATQPVALNGGTLRLQAQSASSTAGSNGLNATYFNFGTNPGIASAQFAGDTLFLNPRSFSRVDAGPNMPQAGASGGLPLVPVAGYSQNGAGAVNNGVIWKGLLNITNPGTYQFKGNNDDNLVLYIDGVQIGTLGVVSGLTNIGAAVSLSAGAHSIVIKHTNGGGGGYARVLYNGGAGTDATADEVLGTDAGSVTTGSLAAIDLGPVGVTANSTLDLLNDATTSSLSLGNGTLTITSQTLSKLTVSGATITAATPTLANQTDALTFTGAIGESSAGLGLNIAGPGLVEFQGANTYTGTTTVTGGQLRLNGASGTIAGNLTVNAANANGDIANVQLAQAGQIADAATVTMTSGILHLGGTNETVGALTMNGGRILGGTLTVANLGASTLTGGTINAALGGAGGLNKTGAGTLVLNGTNTYTGVSTVSNGILAVSASNLGAGGAGNETTVNGTGTLLVHGSNASTETVNVDTNTGLRSGGGVSTLGALNYTAGATAPVLTTAGNGELILNAAPTSTANITKAGAGTLTFNYDVGATLPANIIHSSGNLGFNGTQSFGAVTIGSGLGFKFNSNPGAGVDVTAPQGTTVIAGYAAADTLLPAINGASAGSLALGVNSTANLDFSSDASLSLGAVGLRTYSGTITAGAGGYRLGGGCGTLTVSSVLTGANNLTVDDAGTVVLGGANTFTGTVTVDGAGRLRVINNHELGAAANGVTLTNGGTLELAGSLHDIGKIGALFTHIGNPLATGQRTITIGSGGGTINAGSHTNRGNLFMLIGTNALTGSGTLTKTGYGEVAQVGTSNFSGNLILDSLGGGYQLRSSGSLPNVASLTIGQSAEFVINNVNAIGSRQFPEASNLNRLNDAAPITLRGGTLTMFGNDAVAANELESVGTMTIDVGRAGIAVNKGGGTGTLGAQMDIANLTRSLGGGVLHVVGGGTLGTAGDHSRINPLLLNGAALPAASANGTTLPWATLQDASNFAAVSVTGLTGIAAGVSTSVANVTLTPVAGTRYTFSPTAAGQNLTLAAGNQQMSGLRFVTNQGTPSLRFTNAVDTLFLQDGIVIGDNNNQLRTIGLNTLRGNITAGGIGAGAGAKELFFHQNQNILAVESIIVDNNGAVTVHKGIGGGTLELRAANTYSGGTIVHAGRINAIVAGSLGSGAVTVKGSAIELRAAGTTSSTSGFTITDSSELFLQSATAVYNQPGDRFTLVGTGNMLTGSIANAGQGLASITRVSSITGPGQVIIPAGTHIRYQGSPNGVVDFRGPANLGTDADLFFNLDATKGGAQTITVGAGTPWKGLGSSVGTGWEVGAINANSDFTIQGLNRVGGNVTYALGATGGTGGSYTINNLSGAPINAFLDGRVDLNEDTPMILPTDLTFVALPGSLVVPNRSQSFGYETLGQSRASLIAQAGSTIDPGAFVPVGAAASMPQGMPYPVPSPINTFATFEAGSRLLNNDVSGIGSTTGGATWTMKADSVHHIQNAAAFLGSNSGLINAGQFVYEPGAIVRLEVDRLFKHGQFINNEVGGKRTVLEIFNGNRNITDAVNPFIVAAVGTPTVEAMTLTFGNGGMITNDSVDRIINERRGGFVLEDGAVLAATSQTFLNLQENSTIPAGATVTIGSTRYVDGNPKNGLVQFTGTASNLFGAGAKIVVSDGSAFGFNGTHTFGDLGAIELPAAVTNVAPAGAVGFNPGNGSTLLINTDNYMEVMGSLTGNGAVIGNVATPIFAPGFGATSDFTFAGGVRNANTRNPHMVKVGSTKMTLTGLNDTQGILAVAEGELSITGPNGKWAGGEMRISRGGILTFDNSVDAVVDRQAAVGGGANRWLTTLGGGEFRLLGHATSVADVALFGLATSAGGHVTYGGNMGGFGKFTVVPSGDLTALRTSVTLASVENFQTAGERNSAWLIRGSGLGSLPGTYSSAGVYTPDAGNPKDGLVFITAPNFTAAGAFGVSGGASGLISGQAGSTVVPTAGLFLGATSATATEGDFVTIDIASGASRTGVRVLAASEYANAAAVAVNANITTGLNVHATGALNLTGGDTRFQVLKLGNGANVNVSGVLPLLTQPSQLILNGGGILVPTGATATLNASNNGSGADSVIRTAGGVSAYLHAFGDLTVNGKFFSDIGVVKTGSGTVTFAAGSLNLRGRLAVHEGTVNVNEPVSNVRNSAVNAVAFNFPHLELNGGTVNLNGNSQAFGRLESGNFLPGATTEGGTITSVAPARLTINDAGAFSGHITGAISYDKVGNNTQVLHGANTYTGATTIRQGGIILRANGTLANTSQVDLNYSRIDIDDGHLAYVTDRINPAATINLRGADFVNRGRAGTLTQQHLGTVNMLAGTNLFQTLAGGGGATETHFATFNRSLGTMATFQQNYGFVGTAGNDTTAIRYLLNSISINGGAATTPAALTAANNGILGGWAIVNNTEFATYDAVRGIGATGNTEDGFAGYTSGDLSLATATQNVNDGTARTIAASKTVNSFRFNAGVTMTIAAGQTLTLNTGGLLAVANNGKTITGGSLTSNTSELNAWINENTTTIASAITGPIALVKGGNGTLTLTGANTYTGLTYVGAGSTGTSTPTGAVNAGAANAIPGDLQIHQSTVTATVAGGIAATSNVSLYGGAILNMRDADATTETLNSLTFFNAGGDANNRGIVSRAAARATSFLNLTGATPITANNDNPISTPTISTNIGTVNFTGVGAQTLQLDSPVGVNGLAAAALVNNANIGTVPTGVAEGGLIKAGNGLLTLGGNGAGQFGNPAVATDVFNISSGIVRVDQPNALGPVTAVTTVQSGAKLLLNNAAGVLGSVRLKDGAELSVTLNASILGAVGSTGTLDIPALATTTVGLVDYFVPSTNAGNLTVNHLLTGSGTINLRGIEYAAGYNGGGFFQLRNEANTFTGTVNVNTNTVFESSTNGADFTGNAFGAAAVNLNGGVLRVRDAGNNLAGAQTISYGTTNVTLTANSYLNFDRINAAANNKTIAMGNLNIPAGSPSLWVNNGNGYIASFAQVDGAGTLVKAGLSQLDINGFAGTFSGNIEVAGPKGLAIQPSNNLNLVPATSNITSLKVGGSHAFAAGKTVNVSGALEISNNAGEVINGLGGITTGATTGAVALNSTSTVTVGTLRNNGIVAANNSASAITATTIAGAGHFHAYGADLTLNGALANDGVNPTTLRTTAALPTNAVVLTTAVAGTNTGGADVQSGILRIAPTGGTVTNPLGSGGVRVHGAAASVLGTGTVPIAAQSAALEFAGTTITQAGNITNTGTIRVTSGTTTLSGVVSGTPAIGSTLADFQAATVPGLLEGRLTLTAALPDTNAAAVDFTAARVPNPGNFGVKLEPRMAQTNAVTQNGITGWSDNTTFIYTGYFYDADGVFTFMENQDDNTIVSIDGVTRLLNNSGTNPWQTVTSTATTQGQRGGTLDTAAVNTGTPQGLAAIPANPALPAGWHSIEIRVFNGAGGAGPVAANGFANNYGLGLNTNGTMTLDGTQASRPIDDGTGTLFRTAAAGKGDITLEDSTTLNIGSFAFTDDVTLTSNGNSTTLTLLTASASSDANRIQLVDPNTLDANPATGALNIPANAAVTAAQLAVATGGTLDIVGDPSADLIVTTGQTLDGDVNIQSGDVTFAGIGAGAGNVNLFDGKLNLTGSITGAVLVSGGVLTGNSASVSTGLVGGSVDIAGGAVSPGTLGSETTTAGALLLNGGLSFSGGNAAFTLNGLTAGTGYDQLNVTGTVMLNNNVPFTLNVGFQPAPGNLFTIVANDSTDTVGGIGFFSYNSTPLAEGDNFMVGAHEFEISYVGGTDNNDIVLNYIVPEPGSAALLLGGLAMLAGRRRRKQA